MHVCTLKEALAIYLTDVLAIKRMCNIDNISLQLNIRLLGLSNLYWESFSQTTSTQTISHGPLNGLARLSILLLPWACLWLPTIYLYVGIIQVNLIFSCQIKVWTFKGKIPNITAWLRKD